MKSHIIQRKARMPRSMVYQARYLEDESDNVLVEKGRQEGFSEYSAIKATRASVKAGALFDWWVCSRDLAAAKLLGRNGSFGKNTGVKQLFFTVLRRRIGGLV